MTTRASTPPVSLSVRFLDPSYKIFGPFLAKGKDVGLFMEELPSSFESLEGVIGLRIVTHFLVSNSSVSLSFDK